MRISRIDPVPDPLAEFARHAHRPRVAFLDAAAEPHGLGRWSYLAIDPVETIECSAEDWPEVKQILRLAPLALAQDDSLQSTGDLPPFRGGWIGWFSYELGRAFDRQPLAPIDDLGMPDVSLTRYATVLAWDHVTGRCWKIVSEKARRRESEKARKRGPARESVPSRGPLSRSLAFSLSRYIASVQRVIDYILAGDIFQANLSQRFTVPFAGDVVALYHQMRRRAGASHSAYLDGGRVKLLSMSPELFLRHDPVTRSVETRPIKGTRPRDHSDPARDRQLAEELVASEKDRAENVMIVDLLRNDLHRVSEPDSVKVPELCQLESHAAVHHLTSVVTSRLRPDCDAIDLLEATFPGGSITGAPKLRAMEILAELEPVRRGAYCGAIGWLGDDGAMELNLAIRTVTLADGIAAVHAGGGITALSDPEAEYQETLDKARALLEALEAVS